MILVMAVLDTIGVASIMPFMAVLANPEVVETNKWLALVYGELGYGDPKEFLFFLGVAVFVLLLSSICFKALTQWALLRFTNMRNYSLSCRLFKGYLERPYEWFLNRHSADLGKSVLSEVGEVVNGVVIPVMQMLAHGAVVLFMIGLLVIVDPTLALFVSLVLGGAYLLIYFVIRRYLSRIGKDRVLANKQRFQVAQEALGGIKEVKIFGREQAFYRKFTAPALRFAQHQANSQVMSQLPRYALEVVAFGGVLTLALVLFRTHDNFSHVLSILAVYAFAGYRLLPALQQVYAHVSKLRFGLAALDSLYNDMKLFCKKEGGEINSSIRALSPSKRIHLKDVVYSYPDAKTSALRGMDMEITVNTTVGLVGSTGAGKTTTVDILLGLLWPEGGGLFVDDAPIAQNNVREWQNVLGYVPQQIYLVDDSVAANIAFGVPENEINMESVERSARVAELHDFVSSDLPHGYSTLVGERGVRLSGGQRQRIGIARALYHDPEVLVFDEATSALDNLTEQAVMSAVHNIGKSKTVILIAHRLTTVKDCDRIFFLEKGRVVKSGNFEELEKSCESFRMMAGNILREDAS
ncbi:MAG: ABC transporter ATP-binding protein [Deltaproteobacteria bacterium HGW-Deltaproteobacteria-18]|nr:MAG: ABC transporter ATP-binding protein [Deltaproteobacteria bacterium HGW-Deltaproteobacteria-18]